MALTNVISPPFLLVFVLIIVGERKRFLVISIPSLNEFHLLLCTNPRHKSIRHNIVYKMLRLVTRGLPKLTHAAAKTVLVRGPLLHSFSTSTRFNNSVAEDEAKIVLKDKNRPLRIDRELPDPTTERRKRILGFVVFSVAIGSALSLIFNYEKTESPIISNTLYHLRRSPATRDILGESIEFDGIIPWVYGELNSVKGRINITFYIKGDKNVTGTVRLVADRNTHDEEFLIHEWSVTAAGKKIDLLSENSKRPI